MQPNFLIHLLCRTFVIACAMALLLGPAHAQTAQAQALCKKIALTKSVAEFRKEILGELEKSAAGAEQFWAKAGCPTGHAGGMAVSPVQLLIEADLVRLPLLQELHKYYVKEKKRIAVWQAAVNSVSSEGYSLLDYAEMVQYRSHHTYTLGTWPDLKDLSPENLAGIQALVKFACANGATNVFYSGTCVNGGATFMGTDFEGYFQTFCLVFEDVSHVYGFKKEMLERMAKRTPYGVDAYWQTSGCRPMKMGNTVAPLSHLVAEDVAGRTQFLVALHKYYTNERKEPHLWAAAVNARNSRGYTLLDYLVYLKKKNDFHPEEHEDVNQLAKFVCANGGINKKYENICVNGGVLFLAN